METTSISWRHLSNCSLRGTRPGPVPKLSWAIHHGRTRRLLQERQRRRRGYVGKLLFAMHWGHESVEDISVMYLINVHINIGTCHGFHVPLWYTYTVRCRYNAFNFHQNHHNRHPIARPSGRGIGCLLWVQALIYILPLSLKSCMHYRVILHRVITVVHCSYHFILQHSWFNYTMKFG